MEFHVFDGKVKKMIIRMMKTFAMIVVVLELMLVNPIMAGCCRRAVETKLLKEEQNGINSKSGCGILDACLPPGGNDGDRQASCNAKGCFYASEEDCDYLCRTDDVPSAELQSSDEGTGWSSKLRTNEN